MSTFVVVPEDYRFEEAVGGDGEVRLSELFAPGKATLVIYSFMFPRSSGDTRPGPTSGETARLPLAERPCPSCTSILDSLDGAARHLVQRLNLAVEGTTDIWRWIRYEFGAIAQLIARSDTAFIAVVHADCCASAPRDRDDKAAAPGRRRRLVGPSSGDGGVRRTSVLHHRRLPRRRPGAAGRSRTAFVIGFGGLILRSWARTIIGRLSADQHQDALELWIQAGLTRNQGRGHGRAIMHACETWLRERHVPKLNIMVRADNEAAVGFYEALDYSPDEVIVLSRRLRES